MIVLHKDSRLDHSDGRWALATDASARRRRYTNIIIYCTYVNIVQNSVILGVLVQCIMIYSLYTMINRNNGMHAGS